VDTVVNYEKIDSTSYKKIMKIRTSLIPLQMYDLKNKLEMFATKTGIKPCFLFSRSIRQSRKEPASLKRVASILGLKQRITTTAPLYCSRKPRVNRNFLKAWYDRTSFEVLWAYRDPSVEVQIDKCLKGDLNEGYVLGYPECCIDWHKEQRTLEVESEFADIENFMFRNPLALNYSQIKNEEELYNQVLCMTYPREEYEKVWAVIDQHLMETYKRYPYVPHWACSACLEGKSKETEKLNNRYEKLSKEIDPQFQKKFLDSVKQTIKEFEKTNR
jgi:hypothetical protein